MPNQDKIKRRDIEKLVFGEGGVRRFTQDSAVLPDVWIEYGSDPDKEIDLLITPDRSKSPGEVAIALEKALKEEADALKPAPSVPAQPAPAVPLAPPPAVTPNPLPAPFTDPDAAAIAYNQSTVAAKLHFDQLIRVVLPMTSWWERYIRKVYLDDDMFKDTLLDADFKKHAVKALEDPSTVEGKTATQFAEKITPEFIWLVKVAGTLFFVRRKGQEMANYKDGIFSIPSDRIYDAFAGLMEGLTNFDSTERQVIYNVSRNREASTLVFRSALAVKADAARRLFELSCEKLCWAVIDSGIDAKHPAFRKRHPKSDKPKSNKPKSDTPESDKPESDEPEPGTHFNLPFELKGKDKSGKDKWDNNTRVIATYDFSDIRMRLARIRKKAKTENPTVDSVSVVSAPIALAPQAPAQPQPVAPPAAQPVPAPALDHDEERKLKRLREALLHGYDINWDELEPELKVPHTDGYVQPGHDHGTHVTGILAGDWRVTDGRKIDETQDLIGVCPDLSLYDLRVLDKNGHGDEFSVIAALQFVRHLNAHKDYRVIHGVNMSLSIRHDVANYACGCTPVCDEAERLVNNGTVVVAAAGNKGYMQYVTPEGRESEGYSSISITDPGNADGVLTVGSTHALRPHSYGVSYFSSRGPTGDGRLKPDLVAPGEKITSPVPGDKAGRKDGTSMAAPHVSGAAALLMARHPELVGRPLRIKEILCQTATDLGRERYFQGHGMVDILRALQSV